MNNSTQTNDEIINLLEEVKQQCLYSEDNGAIGVTEEPYISLDLFDRICIALKDVNHDKR